jgi:soluble lytic murein transglycosylase-like protein
MGKYSPQQLVDQIVSVATASGIDPNVAVEQLRRESWDFSDYYVYGPGTGTSGERGVAQFTPDAWNDWGQGPHTNAYDPDLSLNAWARYMTYLLQMFGGRYDLALAGYNGGPNRAGLRQGNLSAAPAASQKYALEILAKAGHSNAVTSTPTLPNADGSESQSNLLLYAAGFFVFLLLVSD